MSFFGCNAFREVGWNPTFKAQGQVYHRIGSLLPETATDSAFLQIYFIADYNQQADARMGIIPENDIGQDNHPRRDIIMSLQQMLHETKSYVRSFKYALKNNTSSDFIIVINADKRHQGEHERLYNAPASNEVSVIVSGDQHNRRDIVIESRGSGLRRISETHRSYDALQYPLLFPYGEDGYNFGILQNKSTIKAVSCRAFYAYLMAHEGAFNHHHRSRELFHQFIVDMPAKMESERLCYIRLNQTRLRCDFNIHLRDALRNDADPRNIGKMCIVPATFTGSPRYMHARTQDAMSYVRKYGRPDLFIIFTCKP
ncbi:unnamed protein product [Acanthosepion pharaonis]|uniref:Helitron helicase-like domain-containing protein n=1 Tax=Acanthosepion pharaonis TaxID=158019 RepID=A0A812B559_ACAPH|nr:unnamed protein product [Sepia pharaonis]